MPGYRQEPGQPLALRARNLRAAGVSPDSSRSPSGSRGAASQGVSAAKLLSTQSSAEGGGPFPGDTTAVERDANGERVWSPCAATLARSLSYVVHTGAGPSMRAGQHSLKGDALSRNLPLSLALPTMPDGTAEGGELSEGRGGAATFPTGIRILHEGGPPKRVARRHSELPPALQQLLSPAVATISEEGDSSNLSFSEFAPLPGQTGGGGSFLPAKEDSSLVPSRLQSIKSPGSVNLGGLEDDATRASSSAGSEMSAFEEASHAGRPRRPERLKGTPEGTELLVSSTWGNGRSASDVGASPGGSWAGGQAISSPVPGQGERSSDVGESSEVRHRREEHAWLAQRGRGVPRAQSSPNVAVVSNTGLRTAWTAADLGALGILREESDDFATSLGAGGAGRSSNSKNRFRTSGQKQWGAFAAASFSSGGQTLEVRDAVADLRFAVAAAVIHDLPVISAQGHFVVLSDSSKERLRKTSVWSAASEQTFMQIYQAHRLSALIGALSDSPSRKVLEWLAGRGMLPQRMFGPEGTAFDLPNKVRRRSLPFGFGKRGTRSEAQSSEETPRSHMPLILESCTARGRLTMPFWTTLAEFQIVPILFRWRTRSGPASQPLSPVRAVRSGWAPRCARSLQSCPRASHWL